MYFPCNAVRAQDSNREVSSADMSVHTGVDERRQEQQPPSDPGHVKPPTSLTIWQAIQPSETSSWRAGTTTSTAARTDEDKADSRTKLPSVSGNLPSQRTYDRSKTAPALKALVLTPPVQAATHELFIPFDRQLFGPIDSTPFSNPEIHQLNNSMITARSKVTPPKTKDDQKGGRTLSSVETAKH